MMNHLSPPQVILALATAAVAAALVLAAPAGAHAAQSLPDAEIFATNNIAVITDPDDPRLDDRLGRFARVVTRIVRDGGAAPRGSELLDGVFFSSDFGTTFERSRRFDVDRVDGAELQEIAEAIGTRFHQESVLTFDHLDAGDPAIDAIELEVPGVSADALRDGLLEDQEAAERLFGGSVTLDGQLILIADLADEEFARAFAEQIGGDLSRAATRRGDREFVEAPAPPPFEVRHRRLFVTGGAADEQIDLDVTAGTLTVDLDGDGTVDHTTKRRAIDRVVVDGGGGQDQLTYTSSRAEQDFDVRRGARGRTIADGGVPVALDRVERLDLAAPGGPGDVNVGDLSFTTLDELHGAFARTRLAGTPEGDSISLFTFAGGPVFVSGPEVSVQIDDAGPADTLRLDGRAGDDQLSGSSLPAGGMRLTIDGGDGSDVIFGGSGDDVLRGGGDFDDVTPNKGNDFVDLGGDNNRSSWKPGDGNDHVVGRGGRDSLFFLGSADAERFDL
ncbi:MAG TPA: hypothetical protein VEX67_14390, partial [Solirubrobacteraceae bacterium]|nr:hypothetical protein [Solirubrobacteraceae bacterium]